MNITLKPEAATQDAQEIESIVKTIKDCMEQLDEAIKATIPSGIETEWSDNVRSRWEQYYGSDVPTAMDAMIDSARNLQLAVDEALAYSKEQ